ncbi:hypothetical protein FB446DRAFT_739529 [Lentinula raphanica]|nr:hypothetical protein FB446DRAFT_739529 [Lentinula raphanica]
MIHAHTLLTAVAFTLGTISTTVLAAPLPIGTGSAMGGTTTIVGGADLTVPTFEEAPGARSPPFPDRGDVDAGLLEVEDKLGVDFGEDYCPPPHPDFHSDAYDDNEKTKVEIVIEDDLPRIPVQDGMPTHLHPVKAVPVPKSDLVGDEYDEEEISISPLRSHSGPESIERRSPKPVESGDSPATGMHNTPTDDLPPVEPGDTLATGKPTGPPDHKLPPVDLGAPFSFQNSGETPTSPSHPQFGDSPATGYQPFSPSGTQPPFPSGTQLPSSGSQPPAPGGTSPKKPSFFHRKMQGIKDFHHQFMNTESGLKLQSKFSRAKDAIGKNTIGRFSSMANPVA